MRCCNEVRNFSNRLIGNSLIQKIQRLSSRIKVTKINAILRLLTLSTLIVQCTLYIVHYMYIVHNILIIRGLLAENLNALSGIIVVNC